MRRCPVQTNHLAEFTCAICCNLVDAPLLTACHHVFCTACLSDWFDHSGGKCPTCTSELDPRHGAGELRLASPLAWRVLGRLQVKCPLLGPHGAPCGWRGEYSELTAHMTASSSHQAPAAPTGGSAAPFEDPALAKDKALKQAEALKQAGNQKFEQRIYPDAIALYTKAIALAPDVPTLYLNRAAAHLQSGALSECVDDCKRSLALDGANPKAHKRLAKALCEQGDFDRAVQGLRAAASNGNAEALKAELEAAVELQGWMSEGKAAYEAGDCALARAFFANMLQKTNAAPARLWLVRAELGLGLCDRALRTTREVIKQDGSLAQAYVLRAIALMFSEELEQSTKHLREALRLDPDDAEAGRTLKKVRKLEAHVEAAKKATFAREFKEAVDAYTLALGVAGAPQHAPISASMHAERAAARLRLHDFEACLKDCAIAIYAQDDCKNAWLTKASALHGLGRHAEALSDMETLARTFENDPRVRGAHQKAAFEVRKLSRPDYYAILNIPSVASTMEIKQAYKVRALECHPDKHTESEEARQKAEADFKLLGEALEVLGDDMKRKLYNEGYDKRAIEERVQEADRAARNHSKDGCCGGGGGGGHHHH